MKTTLSILIIASALLFTHPLCAQDILVPTGAVWKYLDDGSNQGVAWREIGYDDSGWAEGPAELGYGDGDEATVVSYGPDPSQKYTTTYFRHHFHIDDPSVYTYLTLSLLRDDGAVIYLNDQEIQRSNMPDGTINWLTFAASTVSGSEEDEFFNSNEDNLLISGDNVLAVEIHQCSLTSSDISFNMSLIASTDPQDYMRKAPYLIYLDVNTQMQVLYQLTESMTTTIEWGDDLTYSIGSAQTSEYGTDHQHTFLITDLTPATKYYYRVTVGAYQYTGHFYAAPPDNAGSVKFFAYGDTRTYPGDHNEVANGIIDVYLNNEDYQTLIIGVGDLVTDGDIESDWDEEFFDPQYEGIQTLLRTLPYQSCMGNHEGLGLLFQKYFSYPYVNSRYWSFDYGPVHFSVVDQYIDYDPGSAQYAWLSNDLATTAKPYKIVYFHEPGWSAGGHENNLLVQWYLHPLCVNNGVQIVLTGHNHYYARAVVDGIQHVTTGGGGAPLSNPNPSYPNIVATAMLHHFCIIEIDGSLLHFSAVEPDGSPIDEFYIGVPAPSVVLTPYSAPIQIPAAGGSFDFNIAVTNNAPDPVSFDLWTMVTLPNTGSYGPILNVPGLTITGNTTVDRDRTQIVPSFAPEGIYTYHAYIGEYPTIFTEDQFTFEKLGTGGSEGMYANWEILGDEWSDLIVSITSETPTEFMLIDVYPNPFNPSTTLTYYLPKAASVELNVYDVIGSLVGTLSSGWYPAGAYHIVFDGSDLASGVYLARLTAGEFTRTQKLVLLK